MEVIDGIGYGERSGAMFLALDIPGYGPEGRAAAMAPPIKDYSTAQWSTWGSDNLLPVTMADHIEHCAVLNAGLDAIARITAGKGIVPFLRMNVTKDGEEENEYCSDPEINDWEEANNLFEFLKESAFDNTGYGWNTGSYILNKGRDRINRLLRKDVYEARIAKKVGAERFSGDIYLCSDWAAGGTTFDASKHVRVPLLQHDNELEDLNGRSSEKNVFEYAFTNRVRRNGRQYYPMPIWFANEAWVKIARSVPAYKNAIFKNQIVLRYVVTIHPEYWAKNIDKWDTLDLAGKLAAQKITYDRIDRWLVGEDNAGKSLFTSGFFEKATGKFVPYIQVEAIDDKFKDGKLLPDSAAANSEILFALMINPALMGAGQPGGPYSNNAGGSNVRESYLVQMMLRDAERKMLAGHMNVIKKYNGWSKRLEVATNRTISTVGTEGVAVTTTSEVVPRLIFRIPANLMTTLDTGKSTKNETVG